MTTGLLLAKETSVSGDEIFFLLLFVVCVRFITNNEMRIDWPIQVASVDTGV